MLTKNGKGAKHAPLTDYLVATGLERVTMRFDDVGKLVGGLPKSASVYRAWWSNDQTHSQALG